uniref:Uncharacterized protein n=1 Tax=Chromera velia CCMP2878 TaxID=1169474 RepID=A0A0G4HP98_9ALVE|eukprot:Cvel_7736.t1-p1 / transcript=Cvel_7736.t1 / gene=Cvel_7736 / organism=Chromera_velia_CCMP2878 / gene_product=hypothetical protein / transcript_product=hypothetical protein / location=Cvel_scaffold411:72133-74332(+) / protein_length=341 / sequence_SO=supercontig / SO=protein_coding / is_pseudo=false
MNYPNMVVALTGGGVPPPSDASLRPPAPPPVTFMEAFSLRAWLRNFSLAFSSVTPVISNDSFKFPPSDIGAASTWIRVPQWSWRNQYGLHDKFYKDHSGSVCPGRYTVYTNTATDRAFTLAGAFDRQDGSDDNEWLTKGVVKHSGLSGSADANVELVLEIPYRIAVSAYSMQSRTGCCEGRSVSKATVWGSNTFGLGPAAWGNSVWTLLGSHENVTNWSQGETKTFSADPSKGFFFQFKFVLKKNSQSDDDFFNMADFDITSAHGDPSLAGTHVEANGKMVSNTCATCVPGTTNVAEGSDEKEEAAFSQELGQEGKERQLLVRKHTYIVQPGPPPISKLIA